MSQTIASCLQAANRFLERFFIRFSNAHHLAYSAHLGSQLVLYAFEFFKSPAGKFDYHIIAVRHILVQRAVFAAGNIL